MDYSIVIPVYNEEENIAPLYEKIASVMKNMGEYEIIFIDDGSTDGTFKKIKKLNEKDGAVRCIRFRRNFGKTAALTAGFERAEGDVIITMDGDMQNDPEDIPSLVKMLEKYDAVSGWRYSRKDPWLRKKLPSRISNAISRWITGLNLHDFNCALKAYKKEALKDIELYGDMHRYIPAVLAWKGYKVGEIKVRHHERKHGKSKYGARRLLRGFFDLINFKFWADYSTRPLHFFGGIGSALLASGFFIDLYLVLLKIFYGETLSNRPLLLLGILLMILGLQIVFFGFLAEIMIRQYYTFSNKKMYNIKEML
ncbi:MAG: glycosyltransferase [Thermoplasmata archaeon]|nr:glycosyltransferase family 2 protein [Thermoplasmata archaeon]RLF45724.1 MAG: glycosyltransferase [Thermoplasmata archaeon]